MGFSGSISDPNHKCKLVFVLTSPLITVHKYKMSNAENLDMPKRSHKTLSLSDNVKVHSYKFNYSILKNKYSVVVLILLYMIYKSSFIIGMNV